MSEENDGATQPMCSHRRIIWLEMSEAPSAGIVELVADAENAREGLEKRVADLEYMIRRFEANTDFETRQRVAGRRIGPHDTWERWNGERWIPDTVEAGD